MRCIFSDDGPRTVRRKQMFVLTYNFFSTILNQINKINKINKSTTNQRMYKILIISIILLRRKRNEEKGQRGGEGEGERIRIKDAISRMDEIQSYLHNLIQTRYYTSL